MNNILVSMYTCVCICVHMRACLEQYLSIYTVYKVITVMISGKNVRFLFFAWIRTFFPNAHCFLMHMYCFCDKNH